MDDATAQDRLDRGSGRDTGWRALQLVATAAYALLLPVVGVRAVGVEDFGRFAVVVAALALVVGLEWSFTLLLAPEVARDGAPGRVRAARRLQGALAAGVLAAGGAAAVLVEDAGVVLVLALAAAASVATATLPALAVGRGRFRHQALAQVVGAGGAVLALAVLPWALGPLGLALAHAVFLLGPRLALAGEWRLRPAGPGAAAPVPARTVLVQLLPLALLGLSMQAVVTTDLLVLAGVTGAASAGAYRVGSVLPTQAGTFVHQLYDVVLPRLAPAPGEEQLRLTRRRSAAASAVAGAGLGLLCWEREAVARLLLGQSDTVVTTALLAFAAAWTVNTAVHGWALLLLVRGHRARLTRVVAARSAVNAALTLALVPLLGPAGAALGTVLAAVVGDLLLLPRLAGRVGMTGVGRTVAAHAALAATAAGAAGVVHLVAAAALPDDVARLSVLAAVAAGALVGAAVLARRASRRRLV